jgi:hypothetical protein
MFAHNFLEFLCVPPHNYLRDIFLILSHGPNKSFFQRIVREQKKIWISTPNFILEFLNNYILTYFL